MKVLFTSFVCVMASLASPSIASEKDDLVTLTNAQEAYASADFGRARELLLALLETDPDNPDLLRRLAASEAALGNLEQAQSIIDRASKLAPEDADIQIAKANLLYWRGEYRAADELSLRLAKRHPEYPGLDKLRESLIRVQKARSANLRSLGIGGSISKATFASGSTQTWAVQRVSGSIGWDESSTATLELEREDRLTSDVRVLGRVDLPMGGDRLYLAAGATIEPDFRETWAVGAGIEMAIGSQNWLLVDGRFAEYRSDDVVALGAGLRHSLGESIQLTAKSIHLLGGGDTYRLGGSLRGDYNVNSGISVFALAASYPDAEVDGTRQLRAVAGGSTIQISKSLILRVVGEYENRKNSYERTSVGLSLNWICGAKL